MDPAKSAQGSAIWQLAGKGTPGADVSLRAFALDAAHDPDLRVDAVAALALLGSVQGLEALLRDPVAAVRVGAKRTLTQQNDADVRPSDEAGWHKALAGGKGDARAGKRIFFHPGVGCYRCHAIDGLGAAVGPDLSAIARGMDREKLLASILAPSREIAPQYRTAGGISLMPEGLQETMTVQDFRDLLAFLLARK